MKGPLHVQDLEVRVEFHSFSIQEDDDLKVPIPYPDNSEYRVFLKSFPMRLDFGSAGHTHTASLRAEIWEHQPDADSQPKWDEVAYADIETITGRLGIWENGRTPDVINLGAPGVWTVRATARGRESVRQLAIDVGPVKGVEQWLLQFWPLET
ncbi:MULTISPECIES: hypothetical protein [Streptomyces]|uniref:Uncharacterized protein n=1 Tax=Streptomyces luteosporeus TaxID=173856 RepID=A0ABN3U0V2_9ACTN